VSDVEVSRTESLTRHEAARRLAALAAALSDGGEVELALGSSVVTLHVPDHVRCEVEVEVDGAEVELEVELTWSTAPTRHEEPAEAPSKAAAKPRRRARAAG
jgi:amphi-Trp domain-containing protein